MFITPHMSDAVVPDWPRTPQLSAALAYWYAREEILVPGNIYATTAWTEREHRDLYPLLLDLWRNRFRINPNDISTVIYPLILACWCRLYWHWKHGKRCILRSSDADWSCSCAAFLKPRLWIIPTSVSVAISQALEEVHDMDLPPDLSKRSAVSPLHTSLLSRNGEFIYLDKSIS